ncbi:MAG: hypothetical protein HY710_04515 [Candidatus Latescibacteria bacterium]|nr:hypothetical protein [Candidatus Latescibacterota bacterium]
MRWTGVIISGGFVILCLVWPQAAWGQARVGLRGGATIEPDQVHIGFHVQTMIVPQWRFQPNVEIGVNDDVTLIALNPELNYLFVTRTRVKPYLGVGPGINIVDSRRPFGRTDTEVGINFVFGFEIPLRSVHTFMTELKVGVGDSPDLKMTFGVTF